MASKKPTSKQPKPKGASSGGKGVGRRRTKRVSVQRENTSPEAAIPQEQLARLDTLLPEAHKVIQAVEDRMVALQVAATARWTPDQNVHELDENAPPAFGDDEYNEFLSMVEDIADAAMFSRIARFFCIPEDVINQVLTSALTADVAAPPGKKKVGVVSHQRNTGPR